MDASAAKRGAPVPDICPLDRYDPARARTRAGVRWLLERSRGPEESVSLKEDGGVCPALERLLLSGDLYCRVFSSRALSGVTAPPTDLGSLLQLLGRYELIPLHTEQRKPVEETQLSQKPINMGAHLAVIDSLMSLSAMETVGQVKMTKETDQFGSSRIWENSLLFWINKVNQKLRESANVEDNLKSNPCTDLQPAQPSCPQRWYWKLVPIRYRKDKVQSKQTPVFVVVSGVKDLSNGCAIAAAIHFYCPQILPLEDVCLKDTMSVADSMYNLQLIREFCESHLKSCCPLQLEDLLYAPPTLQVNIMCFLSELFTTFEVQKPDFVKPKHTLDLTDASDLVDCTSPISGNSGAPSLLLKQSLLPQSPSVSEGRGWTKKQISRPLSAVTFSIPFPLDSDVDVVMGNPLFRSVSTDSLTMVTNPGPYTPPEDLSKLIGHAPLGELPTIEEALQIFHTARPVHNEPRSRPEGAPSGFYLHSPEGVESRLSSSAPCRSGMMYRPIGGGPDSCGNRKRQPVSSQENHEGLGTPDTPGDSPKTSSPANGPKTGRMTNFAERRKNMPESPSNSRSQEVDSLLSPAMMSPVGAVEAQELGARLEEKRRAIEAQKRRIEAIFTKHRQRLGKTAFLQLQKKQGEELEDDRQPLTLDERLTRMEQQLQQEEDREKEEEKKKKEEEKKENDGEQKKLENAGDVVAQPKLEKQVTFSVETKKEEGKEPPLEEYNEAVAKLTSTLQSLQKDMQRLTEQQQKLMGKKTLGSPKNTPSIKAPTSGKAWVIPAGSKSPATPPHLSRESTRIVSPSGSPSRLAQLSDTPKSPKSSAASVPRKSRGAAPKSPKRQRPSRPTDLGFQPLTRVLTPPQNVDTLPHLRRVSPSQCQVQTCSSLRFGGPCTPQDSPPQPAPLQESTSESGSSDHHTPIFSLELEAGPPSALPAELLGGGNSSGAPSECSFESDMLLSSALVKDETEGAGTVGDDTDLEQGAEIFSSDSMSDQTENESKMGLDVFFKEEGLSEEEMAQKRALLMERQQRRAQEIKKRARYGQDPENSQQASLDDLRPSQTPLLSQSLPTSYTPPPPSKATPPGTPLRRGAFTRAEYERRQQLKIMADLGKVLKQKPAKHSGKKQHAHKPHNNHDLTHTRSPGKNKTVVVNRKDRASLSTEKPASCSESPSKVISSGQLANHNGEKDWEHASNASSPASLPEYTGPKLFKEPSFKSNKFIIHNALSRCCLAGKVNESQKNKIIEEMEKSSASHFLILLRDSNCQFRAIYTLDGQSEELHRICGVGPRVISSSAVEAIYKYSSDRKQFNTLPSRTLSMSVDAFTIPAHVWHTKKHGTPKKVATPK
ncbi:calmodulin-regulated spectrin-associated protein 3 isoform X2 [Puntigrus tetrazona]|uniref:calmodulin-regulated spectrin-associated protein 3 isoform X2 n=1 Tax=Puntigrus tetrazona TaxID=1606681 RepID=UPI001C8AFE12|nr:calmodulin-regulated spectrin-associated protein 3 isoform X2 [Puntigrus tetrazona]